VTLAGLTSWNLQMAFGFDITPGSSGIFNDFGFGISSAHVRGEIRGPRGTRRDFSGLHLGELEQSTQ